jgi:hypothetical protein
MLFGALPVSDVWANCTLHGTVCVTTSGGSTNIDYHNASLTTYAWDSTTTNVKTNTLNFTCTGGTYVGYTFTVKDEIGTAGTYPIVVTGMTGSNDTFDSPGATPSNSFTLNSNYESITFQCDGGYNSSGNGNWMVE